MDSSYFVNAQRTDAQGVKPIPAPNNKERKGEFQMMNKQTNTN